MNLRTPRGIFRAALLTTLLAMSVSARDRHELNGTWTLVPARSDFAGQPAVQTGTVTIVFREGNVTVSRNLVYEGAGETVFYNDMTDSRNGATIHAGKDLKSKTRWDGDVLKVTTTDNGAVTEESYAIGPDGTMTVHVERPDRKAFTLLFERR